MSNGGVNAQRGFIFQSIIAMIECLERDDWDEIKMEPETKLDKVDFVLSRNGAILSAEQVKSRQSAFGDKDVKEWLEKLKGDAPGAEEYCLCLVGDSFTDACEDYIEKHRKEIKKVSFEYLQDICTGKLAGYARKKGLSGRVTIDDLDLIDDSLFSKIHRNSISGRPMSRAVFEAAFQRVIPIRKTDRNQPVLPIIRNEIDDPCETFVEGAVRSEDLVNIKSLLMKSRKPLWLHGEGGIGKTELVLYFANTHPEYEYVFIKYAGSINQTVSKDIFILPDHESGGRKLNEEERYHANYDVFRQYAVQLKQENRNLVLIIDNYCLQDYETELREQTDMDIYNGFAGVDNDLKELDSLIKTGIRIVLTTRVEPQRSDIFSVYEIRKMSEEDLLRAMVRCFTRIRPYLGNEGVSDKLLRLIRIAESWTVYVTAVASIMQESDKGPVESLDALLEMLGPDKKHRTEYSKESLQMQDILEKVLGFIGLSYQEKQVLMILTMLPDEGMEYELYQKLTTSNAVQLDRLRRLALERLIKTRIVIRDQHQKGDQQNGRGGKVTLLRMHPIIAEHAQKILAERDIKAFLNLIKLNWVNKLVHYFDDESFEGLKIDDKDYRYVPLLAIACSATEHKLKELEGCYRYTTEEIAVLRENLLIYASKMSDKIGYAKDALEYIERAIAVDGPSSESMSLLLERSYTIGTVFFRGGKYPEAKQHYLNCLQILNAQNVIVLEDIDCPKAYGADEIIQSGDAYDYSVVFNSLGNVYERMGDYGKTLEYDRKALAIKERVLGTEHPSTAVTYHSIGVVYERMGDYGKALEYYRKALAIKERVLGTEHRETAAIYHSIGDVYERMGDYGKTLEYHRKALAIKERVLGTEHPETAVAYHSIGDVYESLGDYGKALEYDRKALAIKERVLGTEHPETAVIYHSIGDVYESLGDYGKALEYYRKALAIKERVLGTEHPETAVTYHSIGDVYESLGDYGKVLEYYRKALAIKERVLGTEHPETAVTYHSIGDVYESLGDYGKALEYYRKTLAIKERVLGTEHPETAVTYHSIGNVYERMGDYGKALEYYRKDLAITERALGTEHPSTAATYHSIGDVYERMGDYGKALEYYRKDLAITERALGTEHPSTAATYHSIGDVYERMGDYGKALEYDRKALAIKERVLGTEHPETAVAYHSIGDVYESLGDYGKALEYYRKDLAITERVLGTEHPDTAATYHSIGDVYERMGDYGKALEYYRKDLAITERVLGTEHPDTAVMYRSIGTVYRDKKDYEKAMEYYRRAIDICERVLGTEHPKTAITYNDIGTLYADKGDYEKAMEYYGKALTIREQVLGKEHPDTATTYNDIGTVYRDKGDYEKAMEYFKKSICIKERVLGENSPFTAWTYNNMAMVYECQNNFEKALEYYQRALGVHLTALGEEHPRTKIIRGNIEHLKQVMN